MKLDLGERYVCGLCQEHRVVEGGMRFIHLMAEHELIAATFINLGASFEMLFLPVEVFN